MRDGNAKAAQIQDMTNQIGALKKKISDQGAERERLVSQLKDLEKKLKDLQPLVDKGKQFDDLSAKLKEEMEKFSVRPKSAD